MQVPARHVDAFEIAGKAKSNDLCLNVSLGGDFLRKEHVLHRLPGFRRRRKTAEGHIGLKNLQPHGKHPILCAFCSFV